MPSPWMSSNHTITPLEVANGAAASSSGRVCVEIVRRVLGHRDIGSMLGYAELAEAHVAPRLRILMRVTLLNRDRLAVYGRYIGEPVPADLTGLT